MIVKASDFGVNTDNLPKEQKEFMEKMLGLMCEVINKSAEGSLSKDEVEKQFKSINDEIKSFDGEKFSQLVKDNEELVSQVKKLGDSLTKLQQKGVSLNAINKFDEKLNEMLGSEKFQDFVSGKARKSGEFAGFSLKDVVSMTNNYTGDHLTTQQQSTVVSQIANKKIHLRDVITTLQGDAEYPNLAFAQVYDFDRNARYVTENGKLPQSSIKVKEIQTATKRLGTYIKISKRMLKSRVYIRSFILNMFPESVFMAEDYNILFGDGNGENLLGIANQNGVIAVEKIIAESIITGKAGDIKSIEKANNGKDTIVEFSKPHDIILDGMTITLSGATTNTNLNTTHSIVKMNDRQIMLVGASCSEVEASVADMTFTVTNSAFKSIEDPNSLDVVKTALAVMTFAQYTPNAIILNPITVNAIDSEKDTTGRNLGLVQTVNGIKTIAGCPIIEYTGIPAGKYLLGDFTTAANLVDYTSLSLEWAEDVESKIGNEVCLIAQEEVIFPVYMPWAFSYGDLSALKTAITKG